MNNHKRENQPRQRQMKYYDLDQKTMILVNSFGPKVRLKEENRNPTVLTIIRKIKKLGPHLIKNAKAIKLLENKIAEFKRGGW